MSGVRSPDCSKLVKNPKNENDVTVSRHDLNVKSFWRCFVSLVKFSYWSTFHVIITSGFGIMTIFFYKGLTRNQEIGNTTVWVLPKIWRLERVMDTKFGINVPNRTLQNSRVTAFTVFELLKEIQLGRGKITLPPPPPPRLGSIENLLVNVLHLLFLHLLLLGSIRKLQM